MKNRRAVPFVPVLTAGSQYQATQAAEQLNGLIQQQEDAGWYFVHLDSLATYVHAGCLGSLFGQRSEVVNVQLAIFEREA